MFYREAGPSDGPVLLLPHGYPCSSYEFRNFMPALADTWRLIAPDFPGSGLSGTPEDFRYDFDGFAEFLGRFATAVGVDRCALYLHDFGSQVGLRFAIRHRERITAALWRASWGTTTPAQFQHSRNCVLSARLTAHTSGPAGQQLKPVYC